MFHLSDFIKGAVIGIAAGLPGVSGGTLAVALGVYDRVITAVNRLWTSPKSSLPVLFPYGLGGILGAAAFSFAAEGFLERWPLQTSFLFIGLILSGVPAIAGILDGRKLSAGAAAAFLFALIFVLGTGLFSLPSAGVSPLPLPPTAALLCLMGFLSAAATIVPGISGSMLLMMTGCYSPLIRAVNSLLSFAVKPEPSALAGPFLILAPFGAGFAAGLFFWAYLAEQVLKRFRTAVFLGILGLVLASPAAILLETAPDRVTPADLGVGILLGVLSLAISVGLERPGFKSAPEKN